MGTTTIARDGRAPSTATVAMVVALALVIAMLAISVARMRGAGGAREVMGPPTVRHADPVVDTAAPDAERSLVSLGAGQTTALPASLGALSGAESFVVSPDGRRIAFVGDDPAATTGQQLYVMRADGAGVHQVTSRARGASSPAWSPDGTALAYVAWNADGGRDLFVTELADGATRRITRSGLAVDATPGFLADGRIAFTATAGARKHAIGIWAVDLEGGDRELLIDRAGYGSVSPNGSTIAYHPMGPAVDPMTYPMDVGVWLADAERHASTPADRFERLADGADRLGADPARLVARRLTRRADGPPVAACRRRRARSRRPVRPVHRGRRRLVRCATRRTSAGDGDPRGLTTDTLVVESLTPTRGWRAWPAPAFAGRGPGGEAVVMTAPLSRRRFLGLSAAAAAGASATTFGLARASGGARRRTPRTRRSRRPTTSRSPSCRPRWNVGSSPRSRSRAPTSSGSSGPDWTARGSTR